MEKTSLASFVIAAALSGCGQRVEEKQSVKAFGIEDPVDGMRYIFVSPVDQQVWGILCKGSLDQYIQKSPQQIRRCEKEKIFGPVEVDEFVARRPSGTDRRSLEEDLRRADLIPISSANRDRYYDLWRILVDLSLAKTSCENGAQSCLKSAARTVISPDKRYVLTVEMAAACSAVRFVSTAGPSQFGNFVILDSSCEKTFYLNPADQALIKVEKDGVRIYYESILRENLTISDPYHKGFVLKRI